ncbi:MAG TPA: CHAT domain-containing tetratricopeptide repeat protein [Thermoanaerobaculia bacterium]|nr:CHAT domain-containing tetratricopeptide repeat protein [Thermoanaerobaculia bacterium]
MQADLAEAELDVQRSKYQEAVALYLRWLPEILKIGCLPAEAGVRLNLGIAYDGLGDSVTAASEMARALEISMLLNDEAGAGSGLMNLGVVLRKLGNLPLAKQSLETSFQVWCHLGDRASMSRTLANLALVSAGLGKIQEAQEQIREALELSDDPGDRARLLLIQSCVSGQAGDFDQAMGQSIHASELGFEAKDVQAVFGGQLILAVSLVEKGDLQGAYDHLINALDLAELQGVNVTSSELKATLMGQFFNAYAMGVILSAELGRPADAFRHAEQAKARALLDQFWQPHPNFSGANSELLVHLRELPGRRAGLSEEIRKESRKPLGQQDEGLLSSRKEQLDELRTDETTLLARLKVASPGYAGVLGAYSGGIKDVQGRLDDRSSVVEYFISEKTIPRQKSGGVYAWVIWKNGFELVQLAVPAREVARKVILLRHLIGERGSGFKAVAAELFQNLFAPLAPHVRNRNLIIVPHGVLHQLPFAALWNAKRKRYLLDDYVLSQAPSASILDVIYGRGGGKGEGILVLGDPDGSLPYAAQEARKIAELYGVQPLLGKEATESAVVHSGPVGILHVAAHGVYDAAHPLFSRLELAPGGGEDGRLEMQEILGLNLKGTSLVVLSGCRTQAEEATEGDELAGLPRAWLLAGARSVLGSLWNVNDRSTATLMQRFHGHLREGMGPAEALRRAQIETRAGFPHPYDWAAFVLSGAAH